MFLIFLKFVLVTFFLKKKIKTAFEAAVYVTSDSARQNKRT